MNVKTQITNCYKLLANSNRYEGEWASDKKNGKGKYFFLSKGQMLEGFWVNDINKTGCVTDFDRDNATDITQFEIPAIHLENSDKVVREAIDKFSNI